MKDPHDKKIKILIKLVSELRTENQFLSEENDKLRDLVDIISDRNKGLSGKLLSYNAKEIDKLSPELLKLFINDPENTFNRNQIRYDESEFSEEELDMLQDDNGFWPDDSGMNEDDNDQRHNVRSISKNAESNSQDDSGMLKDDNGIMPYDNGKRIKFHRSSNDDNGIAQDDNGIESGEKGIESGDNGIESGEKGIVPGEKGIEPDDNGIAQDDNGINPDDRVKQNKIVRHSKNARGSSSDDSDKRLDDSEDGVYDIVDASDDSGKKKKSPEKPVKSILTFIKKKIKQANDSDKSVDDSDNNTKATVKSKKVQRSLSHDSGKSLDDSGKSLDDSGKRSDDSGKRLDDSGKRLDDSGTEVNESVSRIHESDKPVKTAVNLSGINVTDQEKKPRRLKRAELLEIKGEDLRNFNLHLQNKLKISFRKNNTADMNRRWANELLLFYTKERMRLAEIQNTIGASPSTLMRDLNLFRKKGWVTFMGITRTGHYVITEEGRKFVETA